jgi:hypothetical protein
MCWSSIHSFQNVFFPFLLWVCCRLYYTRSITVLFALDSIHCQFLNTLKILEPSKSITIRRVELPLSLRKNADAYFVASRLIFEILKNLKSYYIWKDWSTFIFALLDPLLSEDEVRSLFRISRDIRFLRFIKNQTRSSNIYIYIYIYIVTY